ncbi:PREDICTED: cytochrome c oxidase subunit 7A1, mitochondrial [Condylura cristata]|uniref:cytochrome c oxidase subunit 7A1, mitochondrial n=1 Tax=Condylura cristata TaxID=143302 RepID=UPI0006436771|nr:PREDICTED: cytochrome c oxidase subunit 7A1, mitochondrial [Condylura cristata]
MRVQRVSQALFRAFSSTSRTHMANRVAEKQKLFQADNDLPVHLKGGGADNILYRLTMALVTGGEYRAGMKGERNWSCSRLSFRETTE